MKIIQIGVGPKEVPLTGYLQDYWMTVASRTSVPVW
jgi:hypothetical protein